LLTSEQIFRQSMPSGDDGHRGGLRANHSGVLLGHQHRACWRQATNFMDIRAAIVLDMRRSFFPMGGEGSALHPGTSACPDGGQHGRGWAVPFRRSGSISKVAFRIKQRWGIPKLTSRCCPWLRPPGWCFMVMVNLHPGNSRLWLPRGVGGMRIGRYWLACRGGFCSVFLGWWVSRGLEGPDGSGTRLLSA